MAADDLAQVGLHDGQRVEMGFVIPSIRFHDASSLGPNQYSVKIKGEEVARGEILVDYYLALPAAAGAAAAASAARTSAFWRSRRLDIPDPLPDDLHSYRHDCYPDCLRGQSERRRDPFSCRISNNFGIYAGNSRAQCKNC